MLMDILMESLLAMDEDILDYVLESCSDEEIELIDDMVMEMQIADRNDPDVQDYVNKQRRQRKEVKERFANNDFLRRKVYGAFTKQNKDWCRTQQECTRTRNEIDDQIKRDHERMLHDGINDINAQFNPIKQRLQQNIDALKQQKQK